MMKNSGFVFAAFCLSVSAQAQDLSDQYGRADSLANYAGDVTLAIVVPVRRLRLLKPWERALSEQLDDLPVIRVTDVSGEKNADYGKVAEKLQKRVPPDVSVLIDMEGQWAQAYELSSRNPCLLVFDREGELANTHCGRKKKEAVNDLVQEIESLRKAG